MPQCFAVADLLLLPPSLEMYLAGLRVLPVEGEMSLVLYFVAVIMLNQALPTNLVIAGTVATGLILAWRCFA